MFVRLVQLSIYASLPLLYRHRTLLIFFDPSPFFPSPLPFTSPNSSPPHPFSLSKHQFTNCIAYACLCVSVSVPGNIACSQSVVHRAPYSLSCASVSARLCVCVSVCCGASHLPSLCFIVIFSVAACRTTPIKSHRVAAKAGWMICGPTVTAQWVNQVNVQKRVSWWMHSKGELTRNVQQHIDRGRCSQLPGQLIDKTVYFF